MEKALKYYVIFVTGLAAVLDAVSKQPKPGVKFENPTTAEQVAFNKKLTASQGWDIAWQKIGRDNPAARAAIANYDPRFFQTEMVEVNLEKDSITTASGKTFRTGSMTTKGKTVNVFATRHREIFKAITEEIMNANFTLVIPPSVSGTGESLKVINPVCRIEGYVQPGYHLQFPTGFEYEVYNRDPQTHAEKAVMQSKYNKTGVLEKKPLILSVGDIFLFPNELDAMEAHKNDAIAAYKEHEVKKDNSGNQRTDDIKDTAAPVNEAGKQADVPVT
jgi:hypothetical protein